MFRSGRLIDKEMNEITLAPKENLVLNLLIERANEVVTKEDFIKFVWKGGIVSDESLTRCIYVLRRVLGHCHDKRFIQTVYGKGYRFVIDVQNVSDDNVLEYTSTPVERPDVSNYPRIALFPFEMKSTQLAILLHDVLIGRLQQIKRDGFTSIHVVSSFVTRTYRDYSDFLLVIEKSNADYYITGAEVQFDANNIIRLELVRSCDHSVLAREGVKLTTDLNLNLHMMFRIITVLLFRVGVVIT